METITKIKDPSMLKPGFGRRSLHTMQKLILMAAVLLNIEAMAQCSVVAAFSYGGACLEQPVQFSDASAGNIVTWAWDFGDGNSLSGNPPMVVNQYTAPGTYLVQLIVSDNGGCLDTATQLITVYTCSSGGCFSLVSPLGGATINNRCDLQFCVYDSAGIGGQFIVYSDIDQYYAIASGTSSQLGQPNTICLEYNDMYNGFSPITAGTHTFYLYSSDGFTSVLVDSISLNIANTITNLKDELNFTYTPSTNGNYDFSVSGLTSSYNYTLYLQDGGNYIDSLHISNSTSVTLTHQFPYNAVFDNLYLTITSPCNGGGAFDTVPTITITNSSCTSFTQVNTNNQLFTMSTNCVWDTIHADMDFYYENLAAGTAIITVNWGDGTTDTYPYIHAAGNGNLNLSGYLHSYATPGVYTILCTLFDPSACYNDSLVQTIDASDACGNLTGTVYNDANNNCTQDLGEVGIPNVLVTIMDGNNTYYAWTDYLGYYSFPYVAASSYTIQVGNLNQGYTITCSNSLPHTVNLNLGNVVANFAINCASSFDLAVTHISLMNGFFPGVGDALLPHVGMLNGSCNTAAVSGKVIIVLDACIEYSTSGYSFYNAPDVVIPTATGDTLIWNVADINNIGTFGYWDYAVNTMTCTTAQVGDTACITVMVLPTSGDADLSNNTLTQCFEIGVSYDPNNKLVLPAGLGTQGFIPADEPSLTYTINFQNTGTAVARNIYVMDTIDTDLDYNSIEILNASHRMQAYGLPNRAVKFMFPDIMLPDSTHDEVNSHGYVTFKINLNAGLTPGTQMHNTGHIYFDYNDAVVTNTALNTIEFPSSIGEMKGAVEVKVYPNPAKEVFTVFVNHNGVSTIVITDILGKTVKQLTANDSRTEIDATDMPSGVYFVKVTQGLMSTTQKVVISK
jgi:PKD repeat protein